MRVGLSPTPWILIDDPGRSVAATTNGAADEKSPGIESDRRMEPFRRPHGRLARFPPHPGPRRLEHALRVVAARMLLDHGGPASIREQPGQEHARLHLRARDRQLVANRPDRRPAFDDEGRMPVLRLHLSAHLGERLGDPPEGPARE